MMDETTLKLKRIHRWFAQFRVKNSAETVQSVYCDRKGKPIGR